ncbi:MAG: B12-binding domain-containing protein [Phycisphaerales bacterium]|nr:B12-binding domain-containing protein [Phycisphaerales bacterium]MCB9863656.1 B12-binding domain-containing protein [Phycisphaerales bacterium]
MSNTRLFDRYVDPLLKGQRSTCRTLITEALEGGTCPKRLYQDVVWPAMEHVDRLYRDDHINVAVEHMATRINRTVADHIQSRLERSAKNGKRIIITSADGEAEEISAQMCADLFEAAGWEVYFLGAGIPRDEMGSLVGQLQPDTLMIVGSKPTDVPIVRQTIDYIREINACPRMNVLVSGGVFNRAEGLWREVKADFFAQTASEALEIAIGAEPRKAETKIPGAPKKRRRRRRPPLLAQMEASA